MFSKDTHKRSKSHCKLTRCILGVAMSQSIDTGKNGMDLIKDNSSLNRAMNKKEKADVKISIQKRMHGLLNPSSYRKSKENGNNSVDKGYKKIYIGNKDKRQNSASSLVEGHNLSASRGSKYGI